MIENPVFHGFIRFLSGGSMGLNIGLGLVQNLMNLLTRPTRTELAAYQLEETEFPGRP